MSQEISSESQKHQTPESRSLHRSVAEVYGPPAPEAQHKLEMSHHNVAPPSSAQKDSERQSHSKGQAQSSEHKTTQHASVDSAMHSHKENAQPAILSNVVKLINAGEKKLEEVEKELAAKAGDLWGGRAIAGLKPESSKHSHAEHVTESITKTKPSEIQPEKTNYSDLPQAPLAVHRISDRVNKIAESHRGQVTFTHDQIASAIPSRGRDNPLPHSTIPAVGGIEDTLAAVSGANKQNPYETVTTHPDGTMSTGRYGFNQSLLKDFLAAVISDMPVVSVLMQGPPHKSMAEVLAEHTDLRGKFQSELALQIHKRADDLLEEARRTNNTKLLEGAQNLDKFAKKFLEPAIAGEPNFTSRFADFIDRLAGRSPRITAQEVKEFLPTEMQEFVAQNQILRYSKAIAGNLPIGQISPEQSSQITLAMFLGRRPTHEDLANEHAQNLISAAKGFFTVANVAQLNDADVTVTAAQNELATLAEQTAKSMNTIGWCAKGVETTLQKMNIHVTGNACDTVSSLRSNPHLKEIDPRSAKRGSIVVLGASASHPFGHIKVVLGNGREASDHVQNDVNESHYGSVHAFELV